MQNIAEKMTESVRTKRKPVANPGNKITARRRKLYQTIKERTGNDNAAAVDYSLQILRKEKPRLEQYVLSKNEVPLDDIADLAVQAYKLRCKEIDETMHTMNVNEPEAVLFLEEDENETLQANNYEGDNMIGELFAPIGIVATYNRESDNYVDSGLLSGVINTIGGKLDSAQLKRAAQNKPSGIIGALTGGKKEYDQLRSYLQNPANKAEKDAVLKGIINDVSQLAGYQMPSSGSSGIPKVNIAGKDVIDEIARIKRREMINKALPFIIIGLVVIVFVTIYLTKHANKNK